MMIAAHSSSKPCGNCRRHENVENHKTGFPHFHSALENSSEFPTASTRPDSERSASHAEQTKAKSLHGEYPIKGWHGVNLCRYSRMN